MAKVKTKVKTIAFRSPYYELADSVQSFKTVSLQKKDAKLKASIVKIKKELDIIHKHLESKYIWD